MEWMKQAEEMTKTWTEAQKKMWDNWLKTTQQSFGPSQVPEIWQKMVETWEGSVESTLDAQAEWMRMWANNLSSIEGTPKETVDQVQEMAKRWSESQKQLWASWFEMARKFDPAKMPGLGEETGQQFFQVWQESAQKVMDAQAEWVRTWTGEKPKE